MNLLGAALYAVPSVFAFLAWLQGRRNGRTAKAIDQKTEVIHGLVNSAMSALKADLALANQRITSLQDLVNQLTSERANRDAAISTLKGSPRT